MTAQYIHDGEKKQMVAEAMLLYALLELWKN